MTVGMRLSDQNVLPSNHIQTLLQYGTHVLLPLYLPFFLMYLERVLSFMWNSVFIENGAQKCTLKLLAT
jgi:hypothetical protein